MMRAIEKVMTALLEKYWRVVDDINDEYEVVNNFKKTKGIMRVDEGSYVTFSQKLTMCHEKLKYHSVDTL